MNYQFDELTKSLAQSATRRAALKKFGLGLTGVAAAFFGLVNKGTAQSACLPNDYQCTKNSDCCSGHCRWHYVPTLNNTKVKVWTCVQ